MASSFTSAEIATARPLYARTAEPNTKFQRRIEVCLRRSGLKSSKGFATDISSAARTAATPAADGETAVSAQAVVKQAEKRQADGITANPPCWQ